MSLRHSGLSFCLLLAACGSSDPSGDGTGTGAERFVIEQPALTESSGLARSHRESDLYWSHNDSGGPTALYAFDATGQTRGVLQVQPALNLDWEDMSSFVDDGVAQLLVADVGDNGAIRPLVTLYFVEEPELGPEPVELSSIPQRQFSLLYPDGPRDCEAVAVDADEGMVYLLSKRDAVPRLYRVPLHPLLPLPIAEALGEINIPRAPADTEQPETINWVTSMDFDPQFERLAAVTLTQAHIWRRAAGEDWITALQRAPQSFDLPDEAQIEAVAWTADGSALLITSEGSPTPAARIEIPR